MNSVIDNSNWELNLALTRKNAELEEHRKKSETLQESVWKLEAEMSDVRSSSRQELDNYRTTCDKVVASKDRELKDLQLKLVHLQNKQVRQYTLLNYTRTDALDSRTDVVHTSEPYLLLTNSVSVSTFICPPPSLIN